MNIPYWEWFVRIVIAGILSGVIGWERGSHGRDAGLRTMILVGMGTTVIMITSLMVYTLFAGSNDPILRLDPARIAYGVITGIGFLGAGAIMKDARRIRGLTTAACLWITTAIGLAVGCGLYLIAITTTALALVTLFLLKHLEMVFPRDRYNRLVAEYAGVSGDVSAIKETVLKCRIEILSVEVRRDVANNLLGITLQLRYRHHADISGMLHDRLFRELSALPGLKRMEWT